ncbi:MAG TPA: FecR domain-containing protein [Novosphingobium sp.]|nr:FecR domain-containing protein [Novosphingobium sp.]
MTQIGATDAGAPDAAQQAAAWYARLHGSSAMSADAQAFSAWLGEDEAHRKAWSQIERLNAMLGAARGTGPARTMAGEALALPPEAANDAVRPAPRRALPAAAALVAMLGAGALAWMHRPEVPAPAPTMEFQTSVGQTRRITLADGSVVTMDAASRLRVAPFGAQRQVDLLAGRAFFKVAKDKAHPFIVSVRGSSITALGTAFDVHIDGQRTVAALVEGRIRVDMPALSQVATLSPGMQIAISGHGASASRFAGSQPTEWMSGQVTYDNARLAEVVEDMNRHSPDQATQCLALEDAALGQKRISGVFHTGDVQAVAQALAAYGMARVDSTPGAGCIRLRAH